MPSDEVQVTEMAAHRRQGFAVGAEADEALSQRLGVVALESTLVAHAFAPEEAFELVLRTEERVRDSGAVPATIAIMQGRIHIGLERSQLERLAYAESVRKISTRDIAACIAQGADGALTVGATLTVSRALGIRVVSTGGLGGVHRGFGSTLDISADLADLARTPAVVVCCGVKSILDVPATTELLETLGVPTIGWRTGELPLYYKARGGPPCSAVAATADEAAAIAFAHWGLVGGGVILARPTSNEVDIEPAVEWGLREAAEKGVTGRALTPFLLECVDRATNGATIEPHKRLVEENAEIAGQLAASLARLGAMEAAGESYRM